MSEYDKWQKEFEANVQQILKACANVQIEAATLLLERIISLTPVGNPALWKPPYWPPGYVPGTLKASWEMSLTASSRDAKTGRFTTSDLLLSNHGIQTKINNITISNRQPYAERIENGWSGQAPQGMMRVANLEWDDFVKKAAARNKI